jgi:hypothetical protein
MKVELNGSPQYRRYLMINFDYKMVTVLNTWKQEILEKDRG